jgi:hypothetical protein
VARHAILSSSTSTCKFPWVEDGVEALGVVDLGEVHHGEETEDTGPRFQ